MVMNKVQASLNCSNKCLLSRLTDLTIRRFAQVGEIAERFKKMLGYLSRKGEIKMGKVVERVKVINFKEPSKSIEIEAVIDTGATMSVLPMDLIQKLGLEKIDEVNVRYADNSVRKEVYGWVILEIAGRKAVFDVLAENEGAQPLIGQIVLERLDLVIEPSTRRVIPNPRSPETPMIKILATSHNSKDTATVLRTYAQIRQSRNSLQNVVRHVP